MLHHWFDVLHALASHDPLGFAFFVGAAALSIGFIVGVEVESHRSKIPAGSCTMRHY